MDSSNSHSAFLRINPYESTWINEVPKIDLDSYSANYSGRLLIERLHFIGTHSKVLCHDALKLAALESKKGRDVHLWAQCQLALQHIAPDDPEAQDDAAWCERTRKQNTADTERLEAELKGYKMNLIKESIRIANEELGQHYYSIGDFAKAIEAFTRMRQEITVVKHTAEVCKHLISVNIDAKNWALVLSQSQKLQQFHGSKSISLEEQRALQPWEVVSAGIANLAQGRFFDAARSFIAAETIVGSDMSHICSPNDVAIYGVLCALATMDRKELQTKVLESANFRSYLELEPMLRRAVAAFVGGRYAVCLNLLEETRPDYLLDLYLAPSVGTLYGLIRSKSIVQYCIPFSVVTLDSLVEAFGNKSGTLTIAKLEDELTRMIKDKSLNARIDTQDKVLVHVSTDPRHELQTSTIESTKTYEKTLRQKLQRMNIIGAGLECPKVSQTGRQTQFSQPDEEQLFPEELIPDLQ